MRLNAAVGALLSFLLLSSGCGLNMEKHYRNYRSDLVKRDFAGAADYIDGKKKKFYGEKNRLLYYMDKGMVLHLGKKYKDSNAFLEKAKTAAEELWTDSIGENAAAWITTDNSVSYQGQDFEKVAIHFVGAFNYMETGNFGAAQVEARQITNKLELYNSKYEGEAKSVYRDDAFARWLAGKLAETEGGQTALNDAWIDYKKAIQVYETDYAKRYSAPVPNLLVSDALRVLEGLGADFAPELQELKARYPRVQHPPQSEVEKMGRVVLIHSAGEAPFKRDQFWTARTGKGKIIRIAFPQFVAKRSRITRARMSVSGQRVDTQLAQPMTAIAIQNLNDHMGRIKARAIARAVAKAVGQKVMSEGGKALAKKDGKAKTAGQALQVASVLWNVGSAIAEEADKRSWLTLPSSIGMAQALVPPGPVKVEVELLDAAGRTVNTVVLEGEVKAGGTLFLPYRTFI